MNTCDSKPLAASKCSIYRVVHIEFGIRTTEYMTDFMKKRINEYM